MNNNDLDEEYPYGSCSICGAELIGDDGSILAEYITIHNPKDDNDVGMVCIQCLENEFNKYVSSNNDGRSIH